MYATTLQNMLSDNVSEQKVLVNCKCKSWTVLYVLIFVQLIYFNFIIGLKSYTKYSVKETLKQSTNTQITTTNYKITN